MNSKWYKFVQYLSVHLWGFYCQNSRFLTINKKSCDPTKRIPPKLIDLNLCLKLFLIFSLNCNPQLYFNALFVSQQTLKHQNLFNFQTFFTMKPSLAWFCFPSQSIFSHLNENSNRQLQNKTTHFLRKKK